MPFPAKAFIRYAWFITGFLALVILWGAWVRITGSGAGCGNHWPDCNGHIIPLQPNLKTLIEFVHRLTSGICLPLVLLMLVLALRLFPPRHVVRTTAWLTLFFLLSEAALGAGLVKFELVAGNTSVARAITASLHLVNTFALIAMAALTAWWASHPLPGPWHSASGDKWLITAALVLLLGMSMTGAVTALGDTLFPTTFFSQEGVLRKLKTDLSASSHFLIQLRVIHPLLAAGGGAFLLFLSGALQSQSEQKIRLRLCHLLTGLTLIQLSAGISNILLSAPGWLQLTHLLLAVALWLTLVLLLATVLSESDKKKPPVTPVV
jgi:heme A synthase